MQLCMHGDATGYVFYNGQSALKIQDSGEVTLMHVGTCGPLACCTPVSWHATDKHAPAGNMQAVWCMVQVTLSYGDYPELSEFGFGPTTQQVGQIVTREAER